MQNTSAQLNLFASQESKDQILSPSEVLVRISRLLETEKGLQEIKAPLSRTHLKQYLSSDQTFLYGKTLKELSPQTLAETFGRLSKRLPTLGITDTSGNLLIHHGFYPKIESGYTLSDILQPLSEIGSEYFLSDKMKHLLIKRINQTETGLKPMFVEQLPQDAEADPQTHTSQQAA